MVKIEVRATLESFRRFLIYSTCMSFIPKGYLRDSNIFPERDPHHGTIHVEAVYKVELSRMGEIRFVKATDVLGVIYNSKSGNTNLKWRQSSGRVGRVTGEASLNSVVNLLEAKVITVGYVKQIAGLADQVFKDKGYVNG